MINKKCLGQEALEFILITVLVFFGALFTMIVLGDKLADFFGSGSSVAQSSGQTVAVINPGGTTKFAPDYATYAENEVQPSTTTTNPVSNIDVEGVTVTMNADGSASFTVGTQDVTLPAEILALQDVMLQTSGSAGAQDLIKEVAYMIQKHAAEYPDTNVPIEIAYGTGSRDDTGISYTGNASVNTTSIKVGDHLVIIQQDQTCEGTYRGDCSFSGSYRIEGKIDSKGQLKADVTSSIPSGTYKGEYTGSFSGYIDTSNGININDASYTHYFGYDSSSYKWDLTFTKAENTFQL